MPLTQFNFWMFATVGKLVPCALVLLFSAMIVLRLYALRTRTSTSSRQRRRYSECQGVLNVLVALLPADFRERIQYDSIADIFEMLTVFYTCVTFQLFTFMNQQTDQTRHGGRKCAKHVRRLCRWPRTTPDNDIRNRLQRDFSMKFRLIRGVNTMWRTRDSSVRHHRHGHAPVSVHRDQDADENVEHWL
ncbi:unnamed protein product [Sphagnum balticum]